MDSSDESAAQDRERRVQALRELAREGGTAAEASAQMGLSAPVLGPGGSRVSRASRRGPRLRQALMVLLALAVLASGGLAYLHLHGGASLKRPTLPTQLTIPLDKLGLSCPTGLAWSPDGASLAVTFEDGFCQQTSNGPTRTTVAIFDAHTGAMRTIVDLQDHLTAAGVNDTLIGAFTWSPDGKSLDFLVGYDPEYAGTTRGGIFVQPAAGGQGYLLVGPSNATVQHLASLYGISSQLWSLRDARQVMSIASVPAPALSYTWTPTANAVNITAATQPPQLGASGFSGSPVTKPRSATFSFWQPGTLLPILPVAPDGSISPVAPPIGWIYLAAPTLLSPDGNFVAFSYPLLARVALAGGPAPTPPTAPDARTCALERIQTACAAAPLPLPDKAFEQVLSADENGVKITNPDGTIQMVSQQGPLPVAWRPDGKYLATILPGGYTGGDGGQVSIAVSILATANGSIQNTLKLRVSGPEGGYEDPGVPPFAWSPSGKQLALFDFWNSTLVIWGGSSLPA